MNWNRALKEYRNYLVLEKALSNNSVEAYLRDVKKLSSFCTENKEIIDCTKVSITILREFIIHLHECKSSSKSQARILSGIKSFYHYLYSIYQKLILIILIIMWKLNIWNQEMN